MEAWHVLLQILILLAAALVVGTIAERLRQSAIVGYLLAGAIVGPNVLALVNDKSVSTVAELGAALLLFTIGLEFSLRRLRQMGGLALLSGLLQIVVTAIACMAIAMAIGDSSVRGLTFGIMLAMSSTASILRILRDTTTLETPYGRNALGILLLQDASVLPLTLIVTAMVEGSDARHMLMALGKTILFMSALLVGFYFVLNMVAPRLLNLRQWAANREFPIMLAIVMATGSAYAAHSVGISPAIGAFIAGLMLAESPFAVQIRADVAPLTTILVTIFFGSIGMLAAPRWVVAHWQLVVLGTLCVLILKSTIAWCILRLLRMPLGISLATGLCIANVGEFSFVLAQIAIPGILSIDDMNLVVSVTVISLILAPYLVKAAPSLSGAVERFSARKRGIEAPAPQAEIRQRQDGILLIGFGPAGQQVAEALLVDHREQLTVVELNARSAATAQRYGLRYVIGSATQTEVLETAGIHVAQVVIVTLPDPGTAQQVINLCRSLNPHARVLVRARYHAYRWELQMAGADVVVDEEEQLGHQLALVTRRTLAGHKDVAG